MILRRLKILWLLMKYSPHSDYTWNAIDSLLPLAEAAGYENVQEWLSDTAWDLQVQLAKEDIYNVTKRELTLLLIDENGDREKVMQGYLEN